MALADRQEPDIDRAPTLITLYSAECGIALLFLALRLWARIIIRGIGRDDVFMVATWVLFAILTAFVGVIGAYGGDRHVYYLEPEQAILVTKLNWIAQSVGITALGTGKVAVCFLMLRLFGAISIWRKNGIWVLMVLTSILTILTVIFTYVQCKDPAALWDPAVRSTTYCWEPTIQSYLSIFTQSVNCAVDFALAFLPVTFIWNLQLPPRQRIGLMLLLSGGLFSGICAAIKTSQLVYLASRSDFTWETYGLFSWASCEIFVIIICGCIPPLKPLWDRFRLNTQVCTMTSGGQASGTRSSQEKYWWSSFRRQGHECEPSGFNSPLVSLGTSTRTEAFSDNYYRSRLAVSQNFTPNTYIQTEDYSIQVVHSFQVDYSGSHEV
ncbi:hypothetical protein F4677DRAFT_436728 [Hypoxylon crocopeplum]|nr:hypothetical protein F4677DRAFT_436728 [Hypoxylon crocopeplum]